jgi:hypothetical protein
MCGGRRDVPSILRTWAYSWPSSLKVSSRFSLSFSFLPLRLFLPPCGHLSVWRGTVAGQRSAPFPCSSACCVVCVVVFLICGVGKRAVSVLWECSLGAVLGLKEMRMGLFSVPPVGRLTVGASALSALGLALPNLRAAGQSECSHVTF